jgi:addiction module RelE/StbE family toxin
VKVVWTRQASADRAAIYEHIEAGNPHAALDLDERFAQRAAQLVAHPMIGRPGRVRGTRELVVQSNYVIIYDVEGETIRILRVLHVARQWPPKSPTPKRR